MNGFDLNNLEALPSDFIPVVVSMVIITAALFHLFSKKKWIIFREKKVLPKSESSRKSKPHSLTGRQIVKKKIKWFLIIYLLFPS